MVKLFQRAPLCAASLHEAGVPLVPIPVCMRLVHPRVASLWVLFPVCVKLVQPQAYASHLRQGKPMLGACLVIRKVWASAFSFVN